MRWKINQTHSVLPERQSKALPQGGFTLVEIMVSVFLLALMLAAFYGAFVSGLSVLRVARENLRATQILEERMEVIRLIKWDNVKPGFIPATFSAPYDASADPNAPAGEFSYQGTVSVTEPSISEKYADDLRMIQVDLTWKSGNVWRTRQMTTYVSKYGLQNHIY